MIGARVARAATAAAAVAALAMAGCSALGAPGSGARSPSTSGSASPAPSTTWPAVPTLASPAATTSAPAPVRYVFPVDGPVEYARVHHDYPATDILAACGTPVVAATTAVVLEVSRVDRWSPAVNAGATRGGLSVSLLGADGVRYYGSHFSSIATTIVPGVRVTAGQYLGRVGETGDASACHLHFGISPPCARTGDWWVRRGVIWPWPYLDSWRAGGDRSPVAEVRAWQSAHGCPASAPPGA